MSSRVFGKFSGQTLKKLQNIYIWSRFEYTDAGNNKSEFCTLKHKEVCSYAKISLKGTKP
jgi:hypothetical protein